MFKGALPGFRDFYPQELAVRAFIMSVWRDVARSYSFVEYDGPPLEPLELYTAKSGDEIVGQLYNFRDKGDRTVALRPEMTPTVARMVADRASSLRKPVRWFSMPQLFRYERKQKGRLREHYQLNVDIFGESGVEADAELLGLGIDIMRAFGLSARDVVARVSDRRILQGYLESRGIDDHMMPLAFAVIDKLHKQSNEVSTQVLTAAGISAAGTQAILGVGSLQLSELSDALSNHRSEKHVASLQEYMRYLHALGLADYLQIDLSIVRGLGYYTGIVFEIFDRAGAHRAICGGGRYDNLLASLGGVDMPALGFGMGDVVLGDILKERNLLKPGEPKADIWLGGSPQVPSVQIASAASQLRREKARVEVPLRAQPLKKQRDAAWRERIPLFATLHSESSALDAGLATPISLDPMTTFLSNQYLAEFLEIFRVGSPTLGNLIETLRDQHPLLLKIRAHA